MFAKVNTAGLRGIEGFPVEVEADVQTGLPGFFLTGALSPETREAQYRVMNAIKNSSIHMEPKKITVNFSPAAIRKDGTAYDLPIAIAVLAASGLVDYRTFEDTAFFGETGLDGSLKRVRGALPLAFTCKESGYKRIIVPKDNAVEASLAEGIEVIGCRDIPEVLKVLGRIMRGEEAESPETGCNLSHARAHHLPAESDHAFTYQESDDCIEDNDDIQADHEQLPAVQHYPRTETGDKNMSYDPACIDNAGSSHRTFSAEHSEFDGSNGLSPQKPVYREDFSDVHGQEYLKRAAEIAVSGRHNLLLSGPAGTGKSMIAKRMPTIMPDLSREEDIEISKIYSICGLLSEDQPLLGKRPFRSPHHGISEAAFAGGGNQVMPGEMSLASGGILFLDEIPLFKRDTLEMLRQPMEDRHITVTRMKGSYTYPADFILVAAMNNCACGFYPDRKRCHCTRAQIKAYMGRLSKPLLERIDICAEARPIGYSELIAPAKAGSSESSAVIRRRVEEVFRIQEERFKDIEGIRFNGQMGIREIEKFCVLGPEETAFMEEVYQARGLSGRTYHKILKVARTIADMDGSEKIAVRHLAEAVELRSVEDSLFPGAGSRGKQQQTIRPIKAAASSGRGRGNMQQQTVRPIKSADSSGGRRGKRAGRQFGSMTSSFGEDSNSPDNESVDGFAEPGKQAVQAISTGVSSDPWGIQETDEEVL